MVFPLKNKKISLKIQKFPYYFHSKKYKNLKISFVFVVILYFLWGFLFFRGNFVFLGAILIWSFTLSGSSSAHNYG